EPNVSASGRRPPFLCRLDSTAARIGRTSSRSNNAHRRVVHNDLTVWVNTLSLDFSSLVSTCATSRRRHHRALRCNEGGGQQRERLVGHTSVPIENAAENRSALEGTTIRDVAVSTTTIAQSIDGSFLRCP